MVSPFSLLSFLVTIIHFPKLKNNNIIFFKSQKPGDLVSVGSTHQTMCLIHLFLGRFFLEPSTL